MQRAAKIPVHNTQINTRLSLFFSYWSLWWQTILRFNLVYQNTTTIITLSSCSRFWVYYWWDGAKNTKLTNVAVKWSNAPGDCNNHHTAQTSQLWKTVGILPSLHHEKNQVQVRQPCTSTFLLPLSLQKLHWHQPKLRSDLQSECTAWEE